MIVRPSNGLDANAKTASGAISFPPMKMTYSAPGDATPSRFHATHIPPESLVLAQIRGFATQQEILGIPSLVNTLELSGIQQSRIQDGMVADGRIFCCGGPNESDYALWFYVPEGSDASVGDIVEVKVGALVMKGAPMRAPPNTLQRVRSKLEHVGKECRWTPDDPRLWGRVLYCDWMENEGWIQQSGLFNVWKKAAGNN
jgi:hypothetical protein